MINKIIFLGTLVSAIGIGCWLSSSSSTIRTAEPAIPTTATYNHIGYDDFKYDPNDDDNHNTTIHCRITIVGTTMHAKHDKTNQYRKHQTSCIPVINNNNNNDNTFDETDDLLPIKLPNHILKQHRSDIQSGSLLLTITNTTRILTEEHGMALKPSKSSSKYIAYPNHLRHLQVSRTTAWKPSMTVAVVRVSTLDASPTSSATELRDTFFGTNAISFPSQYNACSFGKLKWSLAPAGVVDVKVNKVMSSYGEQYSTLVSDAEEMIKSQLGVSSASSIADKVIFCVAPGTGTWAASAGVKHYRVNVNNDWCRSISGLVHELGHTLGLLHANVGTIPYEDRSGYMGSGYTDVTTPRKCFNGYHSYSLGWYSNRHYNILVPQKGKSQLINLATFVDYAKTKSTEPVLVNIANTYYLQYNRMKDFNIDTEQKQNQISITQPTTDGTDSVAGIGTIGQTYEVSNFMNIGTLIIKVCSTKTTKADIMVISVGIDTASC